MEIGLPLALLIVGMFAGAVVSGFAGFAFSAVAGAFLLHVLPACEAVPLMMACSLVVQFASLLLLRTTMCWRASVGYIVGGAFGVPPALYVLHHAEANSLRIGFGIFLATYAACMFFRPSVAFLRTVQTRHRDAAVGFAGGLVGGLTAMPGAVPTIWCDIRGLAKDQQRGLVQPYIAAMQAVALAILVAIEGFPSAALSQLGTAIPALLAGTILGVLLYGRVDQMTFRRITLVMLFVGGLSLAA